MRLVFALLVVFCSKFGSFVFCCFAALAALLLFRLLFGLLCWTCCCSVYCAAHYCATCTHVTYTYQTERLQYVHICFANVYVMVVWRCWCKNTLKYSTAYMWCLQDALKPNLGESEEPLQGSRPFVSHRRVTFRGGRSHSPTRNLHYFFQCTLPATTAVSLQCQPATEVVS